MASDKGWNDPPVLSYSPLVASNDPAVKKTVLNKRVPFPNTGILSSGGKTSDGSCADGNQLLVMPPSNTHSQPPKCHPVAPPLLSTPTRCPASGDENSEELRLLNSDEFKDKNLQEETICVFKQCLSACLPTLQKRTAADIERRLGVLCNMWTEGKLKDDVQIRMYKCSRALLNGDFDLANNIHMSLIVDHVSQVTPWMVGIKHLIHESRNIGLQLANEVNSDDLSENAQDDRERHLLES